MLVTTCPQCATTFKLSEAILQQAEGQVRCGRCACVFNGKLALREHDPSAPTQETTASGNAPEDARQSPACPDSAAAAVGAALPAEPAAGAASSAPIATAETERPKPAPQSAGRAAAASRPAPAEPDWLEELPAKPRRRRWPWALGAALLCLGLGAQLIHAYRAELAALPKIGAPLQRVYDWLGLGPLEQIDLAQYELLDLTSASEPVAGEAGWLVIETRVRNKGPRSQPLPHIFMALQDRWQKTVAGRYFSPDEYVVASIDDSARMSPGTTVDAQFIVVDPGPAATGYELQFCKRVERGFICDGDAVFE